MIDTMETYEVTVGLDYKDFYQNIIEYINLNNTLN